jgi:hypothetical protein
MERHYALIGLTLVYYTHGSSEPILTVAFAIDTEDLINHCMTQAGQNDDTVSNSHN